MICLTALALLASVAAAQDEAGKLVSHGPQGYSVDATQTNVVQVLTEMGQHAGFTVEAPDTFNSPITLSVQDAPLDQVLRRVLRNENYIIVYRGGVQKATISGEGDRQDLPALAGDGSDRLQASRRGRHLAARRSGHTGPEAGPAGAQRTATTTPAAARRRRRW